jgi:hypothetical protein
VLVVLVAAETEITCAMYHDAGLAPVHVSFMLVLVRGELRADSARHMRTVSICVSFYFWRIGVSGPSFLSIETMRALGKSVVCLRS